MKKFSIRYWIVMISLYCFTMIVDFDPKRTLAFFVGSVLLYLWILFAIKHRDKLGLK